MKDGMIEDWDMFEQVYQKMFFVDLKSNLSLKSKESHNLKKCFSFKIVKQVCTSLLKEEQRCNGRILI